MKRTITASHLLLLLLAAPVFGAEDPHQGVSCKLCHGGAIARSSAPDDARARACLGCHDLKQAPTAVRLGFHATERRDCTACHSFHDVAVVTTRAGNLLVADGLPSTTGDQCATCHGETRRLSALNEAHLAAAALYHADASKMADTRPSQGCLNCHDRDAASTWRAGQADELRFGLHATHPLGVKVEPGSGYAAARIRAELDPGIPLFDGRIECQTCHDITAATHDLLLPFATPKQLCLGCHQVGPQTPDDDVAPADLMATMLRPTTAR